MKITPAIAIFFANIIIQPLLWGHASHSHDNDSEPLKDSVSLKSGELELELHLNPDDLQIEGTREAKVGDIASLQGSLTQNGKLLNDVQYNLSFYHLEDGKDVFRTSFISDSGEFSWGQQFFDGAEHKITLEAKPATGDSFKAVSVSMNIGVEGIQPPMRVIIKSMILLLTITFTAMVIGYFIAIKKASSLST
tara:strand:- start:464 stop:1042 length:579 start_codon:yes stop_codon:yes gene_type:complete